MSNEYEQDPRTGEEWIRRTLDDAVSDVDPRPDALAAIRARTRAGDREGGRKGWMWATGGAMIGVAATVVAIALISTRGPADPDPGVAGGGTPTATSSPSPSPSPTATAEPATRVPVYYLGEVSFHQGEGEGGTLATGLRLYREWHEVNGPAPDADTAAELAVREMLSADPYDSDYSSGWPAGVDVLSVRRDQGVIEVDLTGPVQTSVTGSEGAELAVQQLVYTVQGALANAGDEKAAGEPVRLLHDGAPIADLWGHVDASAPIARAERTGTQAPLWITAPAEGETLSSPVTVQGVAQVFEGTVSWRVLQGGQVVAENFAMTDEGAPAFADFSFEVSLEPGTYTVEVFESSALDGSATFVDDKQFTIE